MQRSAFATIVVLVSLGATPTAIARIRSPGHEGVPVACPHMSARPWVENVTSGRVVRIRVVLVPGPVRAEEHPGLCRIAFPATTPWTYHQLSGELMQHGVFVAQGYSGFGIGRNNPAMQHKPNMGPIPRGSYRIGQARIVSSRGPFTMPLTPLPDTHTHGRFAFMIHADSRLHPGMASEGCIILPLVARQRVARSRDRTLVVEE